MKWVYAPSATEKVSYGLTKFRIDCAHRLIGTVENVTYLRDGAISSTSPNEYGEAPTPDSVGEALVDTFCPRK
jgi:hypothetical protein